MEQVNKQNSNEKSTSTLLLGLGKGGAALLPYLVANDQFKLVGACDSSPEAVGMAMARMCGIPLFDDGIEAMKGVKPRLVIDATGDPSLPVALQEVRPTGTSVVTGEASRLLWDLLSALEGRRRSDMRYDRLLQDLNSGIVVVQHMKVRFVNPAFLNMFGYEREQILARLFLNFIAQDKREEGANFFREHINGKPVNEEYETQLINREGQTRDITMRARLSEWDGKRAILLIINDVTKLRDLQKEKERFFRFMVHELRAPLAPLVTILPMLREPDLFSDDKRRNSTAALITRSVDRLKSFIDDFLDLSKLDQETLAVQQEDVDLVALISGITDNQRILAEDKGLELRIIPWTPFPIRGDQVVIRTLVQNLVNNSIKYTQEGHIELSVKEKDGRFSVMVQDTGAGFTEQEQTVLFQEFGRIKRTKGVQGTGLGLALVKKLIEACDGKISVSSAGKDQGSTFKFTLPTVFGTSKQ